MLIKLRPHHLICNLCFEGHGYNANFVKNFSQIHNILIAYPNSNIIQIVYGLDDVCQQCPKNIDSKCENEAITVELDKSYGILLKLPTNAFTSLCEIKNNIKEFLTINDFQIICSKCAWKPICEKLIPQYILT